MFQADKSWILKSNTHMKEGYLGNLIVFLKKFCPFEAMKVTFFSPFHSLVNIGKTTHRPIEKKGLDEKF